jgi:teichuronic acid biosynthesis glycosyltransferase TuaH
VNNIIKGRNFIVFGLQPWDFEMGSNCKNVAIELERNNRVLYINRPIERSSLYKFRNDHKIQNRLKSLKKGENVIQKPMENLWVFNPRTILESINWLPAGKLHHAINKVNAKRLAKQIKWAADQLNFTDPILFIDNDFLKGYYLNDFLKADLSVYYIRDFLVSQPYFTRHGRNLEPAFMKKADVVVANSLYLANYAKQSNSYSYDIGQGCELDGYLRSDYSVPADMASIRKPVIGYCGALLNSRLDINLLEKLAGEKKEWNFVLVGPEDAAFAASSLHQLNNVFFTGSKKVEELPAYVHHFDVCINPQILNQMTIGNYPRKIDEYLAAGKPVVATETEAMQMFKEHCYLAEDVNGYIEGINKALKENSEQVRQARKEFAKSHTWEASVNGLYNAINEYQQKHNGKQQ